MTRYFLGRITVAVPTLLIVLLITFFLAYIGPVDPVTIQRQTYAAQGIYLTPEQVAQMRHNYGLDRPFWVQFGTYLNNLRQGNFGVSFQDSVPVLPRIMQAFPITGQLALGAIVILIVVGIPLGAIAAKYRNSRLDYLIVGGTTFIRSIPVFVLIPIVLIILVLWLDLINVPRGWHGLGHPSFWLGATLLSLESLSNVIRQTRAGVLEVMSNDYVRTARAKGLRERTVLIRHVMRNALISVATTLGLLVNSFMTGAVFIEVPFNLPGLGRLYSSGLSGRDFPFIYATVILTALLTIIFNLLVDILYPLLDPRVVYD